MNLYLAGTEGNPVTERLMFDEGVKNRMYSFYTFSRMPAELLVYPGIDLMIDSGGYTARKAGVEISVKKYLRHLCSYEKPFKAITLDTNDQKETLNNLRILKRGVPAHCTLIPVYHIHDWSTPKYRGLLDVWREEFPYIALGGAVMYGRRGIEKFLDWCFQNKGALSFHGLGMTSRFYMQKYPWASVDSSSWIAAGRYGRLQGDGIHSARRHVHYLTNWRQGIQYMVKLEKEINLLWQKREQHAARAR